MLTLKSGQWAALEAIHSPTSTNIIHWLLHEAKKHDLPREPDGPRRFSSSGAFAYGRLIPRNGCGTLVATELTWRLRVNEGNAEISMIFRIRDVSVAMPCQLGRSHHVSWSSRYEKAIPHHGNIQKMPGCRAMECERGHLQLEVKICSDTVRQPVKVKRRDFDAGGGGCHRPARLHRKRGHPSDPGRAGRGIHSDRLREARTTHVPP